MTTSSSDCRGSHPFSRSAIRRIGCISTSRADAGIYQPLLRALAGEEDRQVFCFAGGTHLSDDFGHTIGELRQLDHVEIIPVEHYRPGDRPEDVAASAGHAVIQFADALAKTKLDLIFVLGDRTEMLAAALAALIHRIPIAHLHGGERTAGAYDDQCRHAITKLAHVHFPSLSEYAARLRSLGEEPWRIHTVGALALDAIKDFKPEPATRLSQVTGVDFTGPTFLVVFHPETLAEAPPEAQVKELVDALRQVDANVLILGANADVGRAAVDRSLRDFARDRQNVRLLPSLPAAHFYSCMAHASLMIGNSSAGIIEAASFKIPVVNIGGRQTGRVHPENVINTSTSSDSIREGVKLASAASFKSKLMRLANPYGDGRAVDRILGVLQNVPDRQALLRKL
ncbi:MAG: UDP-N-acetylglucosamine 2-epimerase [Phycisphaerales bacterium]|nr:UDP-N-acetylglucosamine 2-epimerase [Phycisphaerales bacterium]